MVEITIIIVMICMLILFKLYKLPDEVEIITTGLLVGGTCYYLAYNIGNVTLSKIFMILTVLSILMIIFLEILCYLNKIEKM